MSFNRHSASASEKFGLTLDMVQLPLSSRPIEEAQSPHILLGKDPERQRELNSICRLDRAASARRGFRRRNTTSISSAFHAPAMRPGRGGSRNAAFRWSRGRSTGRRTWQGRRRPEEENWERIDAFLAAVVPVAEAAKVRLACHPHDPYTPPGYKRRDARARHGRWPGSAS